MAVVAEDGAEAIGVKEEVKAGAGDEVIATEATVLTVPSAVTVLSVLNVVIVNERRVNVKEASAAHPDSGTRATEAVMPQPPLLQRTSKKNVVFLRSRYVFCMLALSVLALCYAIA